MFKFITFITLLFCSQLRSEEARDIHGWVDVVFKNDYITPRGLLVSDTGLTTQVLAVLTMDVYKSDTYNIALVAGIWNDIWSAQHDPNVGSWNECDWFAGFAIGFCKNLKFSAQYVEFLSPPGHFKAEKNAEFALFYDDKDWGLPVVIHPYAKFFWAIAGDSTVVVGKRGDTFDVEIGMIPILDLKENRFPIILSAPTWITVGPPEFWNGGTLGIKHEKIHFGVFSTGLVGRIPLKCIPARLGNWYVDAGVQYYYLINDNLLEAQTVTLGVHSIKSAHRNICVGLIGFGLEF